MVTVFYNSDPNPLSLFPNPEDLSRPTDIAPNEINSMIHNVSLQTFYDIFGNNNKFALNIFSNLSGNTIYNVLSFSKKFISKTTPALYHQPTANRASSSAYYDTLQNSENFIKRLYSKIPTSNDHIYGNIYIFVGGITSTKTSKGNTPCITLSNGQLYPIDKGIFSILRNAKPRDTLRNTQTPKLLLFIFLSTRSQPHLNLTPIQEHLDDYEIWSIYSKYADTLHGYSSVHAFSGIRHIPTTLPTTHIWEELIKRNSNKITFNSLHKTGHTYTTTITKVYESDDNNSCWPCKMITN